MDFESVARQVFDLYGKQRYDEALEPVETARSDHPDQDGQITFWRACLLGVSERPTEALQTLQGGLERGLWWAPDMLADSDLDSIRNLEGWEEVVGRCQEATDQFIVQHRSEPLVRPARTEKPAGTLITLHGAGADPLAHTERWFGAVPESWTVVAPVGTVPFSETQWAWPHDNPTSVVIDQLDHLAFPHPVVLAGYSQGGRVAASLAWEGLLEVVGLILMAPSLQQRVWDPQSHRQVPTYVVVGELDRSLPECLELQRRLEEAGVPLLMDQRPDLGHQQPEDLGETITAALNWIAKPPHP